MTGCAVGEWNGSESRVSESILGGTFDPIHCGHLGIAEEVMARLSLAQVLFIPTGQPWLKVDRAISPAVHRVEMARLAISSHHHFKLSTMEIDRPGPSYAVDTLASLQSELGAETRLFFILGWDSLAEFHKWKDPARLVQMCQLVAVPRPGSRPPDISALESAVIGISLRVIMLDIAVIDISASDIRRRVAQGLSISELVPKAVERYVLEQRLYL